MIVLLISCFNDARSPTSYHSSESAKVQPEFDISHVPNDIDHVPNVIDILNRIARARSQDACKRYFICDNMLYLQLLSSVDDYFVIVHLIYNFK